MMLKLLFIACWSVYGSNAALSNTTINTNGLTIYNGQSTNFNSYPFIVSIQDPISNTHCCGGSIISLNPAIILTAGHCLFACYVQWYPERIKVMIGCDGPQCNNAGVNAYAVAASYAHPSYAGDILDFDAGIIRLTQPIAMANAQTVTLQSSSPCCDEMDELRVVGYGEISGGELATSLQTAIENFMTLNQCRNILSSHQMTNNMMCFQDHSVLRPATICFGDSGSPVLNSDNTQVAVISWVAVQNNVCDARQPQVGCDIGNSDVYAWINSFL